MTKHEIGYFDYRPMCSVSYVAAYQLLFKSRTNNWAVLDLEVSEVSSARLALIRFKSVPTLGRRPLFCCI